VTRRLVLGLLAALGCGAAAAVAWAAPRPGPARAAPTPPPVPEAAADFFETRVRPVLFAACTKCHGPTQQAGGLRLDSRAAVLKGGARGAAVVPGKPNESLLVRAVSHSDARLRMPPANQLKAAEQAALTQWVRMGAPWPDYGAAAGEGGRLWSVQPLRLPPVPKTRDAAWARNPVDAFVLARLESKGMQPAPPAGRRELLRRLYYDLTGLPPTAEETDAFLADAAPDAYERVVDRLLASPRYGERWARYWLDLVRYADSNGYERDAEKKHSWKYRDYVIRAFNRDKPFTQFVTEQLAGDELPEPTEETLAATGFLRLGTWDDEPNDPLEYRYERLEDVVHATSTAFLALTVKCARCHDHKFDPIPQRDYYALGAAFYGGYLEGGVLGGPPENALPHPVLGFTDKGREAPPLHLLVNGDPRREGPVVEPGFLSLLPKLQRPVAPPPPGARTTRRRLQLAAWVTDPENPLPPRVFVNRVWQHHFGAGLVRTPNNFGRKGDLPTHPELLDWLAAGFQRAEPGHPLRPGSLKSLHRLILLSNTYRMASVHPGQAAYEQRDFANTLLWRQNRRRLDADALRDSMLAVSGDLNLKEGGPGFFPTVQREALEGLSRKGAEWPPSPPDEQRRRTIYMFLKRALVMPLLSTFDFPDTTQPVEARDVTLVGPQALTLLNNPFVHERADALAHRVAREAGSPGDRIERLWRLALGRSPAAAEREAALGHLARNLPAEARRPDPEPTLGLALLLRADQGVTLDGDGRVSAWQDQSGLGRHGAQTEPAARPLLVAAAVNGRPALRFDGRGRFLKLAGQVVTSQQFTVIAVVNDRAPGSGHREIFSNWNGAAGNAGDSLFLGLTGNSIRLGDPFSPAGALTAPERHFALTGLSTPTGAAVYQDRREAARRELPLPTRRLNTEFVIGQQGNIGGEYWNGDLVELRVYNRALRPEELEALWDGFAQRYGVSPRPPAPDPGLASLARVLLNTNEFAYVD
jgi:hypothetical protein